MPTKPNTLANDNFIKPKGFLSMKHDAIVNFYDDNDASDDLTKEPSLSKRLNKLAAYELESVDNMDKFLGTDVWVAYCEGVLVATSES